MILRALACMLHGQRGKYRFAADEAKNAREIDSGENTNAVNADVMCRRAAASHKGLVIFIQTGEADAEYSGSDYEPEASETVDVQRKRDGDSKQEIFGNMCQFTDIVMNGLHVMGGLGGVKPQLQSPVGDRNNFCADF